MTDLRFEWDEAKAGANLKKHGISFDEAKAAFFDQNALRYFDPDHSEEEDRYILLGVDLKQRVLVVCHCFRESESVIRIISARRARSRETEAYWERA